MCTLRPVLIWRSLPGVPESDVEQFFHAVKNLFTRSRTSSDLQRGSRRECATSPSLHTKPPWRPSKAEEFSRPLREHHALTSATMQQQPPPRLPGCLHRSHVFSPTLPAGGRATCRMDFGDQPEPEPIHNPQQPPKSRNGNNIVSKTHYLCFSASPWACVTRCWSMWMSGRATPMCFATPK